MKILLASDLHVDISNTSIHNFGFIDKLKDVDYLFLGGDTCNDVNNTILEMTDLSEIMLNKAPKCKGYYIVGNHEFYDSKENNYTLQSGVNQIKERGNYNNLFFGYNNSYDLDNKHILFSTTLYTNFNEEKLVETLCKQNVSDFKYVLTENGRVTPKDYKSMFYNTLQELKELCEKNRDKKIIVLSHFAPSFKSIAKKFTYDLVSEYFCNNLDDFIKENKNIVLWCHGHTHNEFDYTIGKCRIVCSPYGYYGYEHNKLPESYFGKTIEI